MFKLSFGDSRPLYEQIKEKIRELIVKGALISGEQIPSVRELAAEMAINPNTIQKAYKELEGEGFIVVMRGRGYFVAPRDYAKEKAPTDELLRELKKIAGELKFLGMSDDQIIEIIKGKEDFCD